MAKPVPTTVTGTIAAGTSLSPSIDLTAGSVIMIFGPPPTAWPYTMNVSFQGSVDNVAFYDLFDNTGFEIVRPIVPGVATELVSSLTQGAMYFKIRSGTRASPVPVTADSVFTLVLV